MTSLINRNDEEDRINLQALQNRDPSIRKIVDQAQRVCVYRFLADQRQWERQDLEGSLFVYERSIEPQHGFAILSTVSRETFLQTLKGSMEFKHSPNYEAFLQYKVDIGDIYGLWFISKDDCPRVTETLKNLTSQAKDREQLKQIHSMDHLTNSSDIYSLLLNAQEKFHESKRQNETMPAALLRLFTTTNDEREQELKKTLGIGTKPTLSVTELEKQFLQPAISRENPTKNGNDHPLMTPADFQNHSPVLTLSHPSESTVRCSHCQTVSNNPLSRETLRQLLMNMLQNDDEFLLELHNAYLQNHPRHL